MQARQHVEQKEVAPGYYDKSAQDIRAEVGEGGGQTTLLMGLT